MSSPVSKKLLVLLAVTLVAAAFGVRSLVSMSGGATESGFDGPQPLPIGGATDDQLPPIDFVSPLNPRNPFAVLGTDPVDTDPIADGLSDDSVADQSG